MPSRNRKDSTRRAARTAQALELRTKGHTYQQIGDHLGVNRATACRDVAAAMTDLRAHTRELAEDYRTQVARELMANYAEAQEAWEKYSEALEVSYSKEGEPLEGGPIAHQGVVFLRESRQTLEALRKLFGLDAVVRTQVEQVTQPMTEERAKEILAEMGDQ